MSSAQPQFGGWKEQARAGMISLQTQIVTKGDRTEEWVKAVRPPGVRLMIQSEDGGSLLLTKEYREELDALDYRLPGGKVADTYEKWEELLAAGDDAIAEAVARTVVEEGREEAGVDVLEQSVVAIAKNGATQAWDLYVVLVSRSSTVDKAESNGEIGEDDIEAVWLNKDEVREAVLSGTIKEDRMIGYIWKWLEDRL